MNATSTLAARSGETRMKPKKATKGKRGRKKPPPDETARQRFLRIGEGRMATALDAIRLLSNPARSGAYEWNLDDVNEMERMLIGAVREMVREYQEVVDKKTSREETKKPVFSFSHRD